MKYYIAAAILWIVALGAVGIAGGLCWMIADALGSLWGAAVLPGFVGLAAAIIWAFSVIDGDSGVGE